jgi:hypothetical protein
MKFETNQLGTYKVAYFHSIAKMQDETRCGSAVQELKERLSQLLIFEIVP